MQCLEAALGMPRLVPSRRDAPGLSQPPGALWMCQLLPKPPQLQDAGAILQGGGGETAVNGKLVSPGFPLSWEVESSQGVSP